MHVHVHEHVHVHGLHEHVHGLHAHAHTMYVRAAKVPPPRGPPYSVLRAHRGAHVHTHTHRTTLRLFALIVFILVAFILVALRSYWSRSYWLRCVHIGRVHIVALLLLSMSVPIRLIQAYYSACIHIHLLAQHTIVNTHLRASSPRTPVGPWFAHAYKARRAHAYMLRTS